MRHRSRVPALLLAVVALAGLASDAWGQRRGRAEQPSAGTAPVPAGAEWIDVHAHVIPDRATMDYRGAVSQALAAMDEAGIAKVVVLPPPQPARGSDNTEIDGFVTALVPRARFAAIGGGGTLNAMIQETPPAAVDEAVRRRFEERAEAILKLGAIGFGEITAHHVSILPTHPYESVPADHPLLLLLADIAAKRGVVIDFHFDVVLEDMRTPDFLGVPPNPASFRPNVAGFERLLAHNRDARIVWAHAGSDILGWWTVDLSRRLLAAHPNLYMSLRMVPGRAPQNHPVESGGAGLKPEWLALLAAFPDRFVIGGDQFFVAASVRGGSAVQFAQRAPIVRERTRAFLGMLPPELARKIVLDNARRIYKLEGGS